MTVASTVVEKKTPEWCFSKFQGAHREMYKMDPTEDTCRLASLVLQEISQVVDVHQAKKTIVMVSSHEEALASMSTWPPVYSDGWIAPLFEVIREEFPSHKIIRNSDKVSLELIHQDLIH